MVSSTVFPNVKRNHERGERREDKVTSAEESLTGKAKKLLKGIGNQKRERIRNK